jgi:hypothetical protein
LVFSSSRRMVMLAMRAFNARSDCIVCVARRRQKPVPGPRIAEGLGASRSHQPSEGRARRGQDPPGTRQEQRFALRPQSGDEPSLLREDQQSQDAGAGRPNASATIPPIPETRARPSRRRTRPRSSLVPPAAPAGWSGPGIPVAGRGSAGTRNRRQPGRRNARSDVLHAVSGRRSGHMVPAVPWQHWESSDGSPRCLHGEGKGT